MKLQHTNLAKGRWQKMPLYEQMANIGSEVERAMSWQNKGNEKYSKMAFYRALELLNLTKKAHSEYPKLKEVGRVYELLVDYFEGENVFKTSDTFLKKYFYNFMYLNAKRRGL